MLASLRNKISEEELLRLLLLSPYRASTWEIVDQLSAEARNGYWVEVIPQYSLTHLRKTMRAFVDCLKLNVQEQHLHRCVSI